ncbi:MAG: hypothetical protein U5N58_03425 [Actinomycetota bacterium]|nr:hypothetical protein [Actinomycetota bacterium]
MKLIISEKEIAARRMADILSGGKAKEEKVYGIPTYLFGLDGQNYRAIGLKGHILKVDFPKKYANWFKVDPMDLNRCRDREDAYTEKDYTGTEEICQRGRPDNRGH